MNFKLKLSFTDQKKIDKNTDFFFLKQYLFASWLEIIKLNFTQYTFKQLYFLIQFHFLNLAWLFTLSKLEIKYAAFKFELTTETDLSSVNSSIFGDIVKKKQQQIR
jgi:hypothetical protein